jgi:succinate-semialdehyde dehydrogenase / glutarate-semialdehyde dehydrogenase
VKHCAASRLLNTGQSCIAAKRFVVVEAVHDAFVEAFAAELKTYKQGDPMDETTQIGAMASVALRDELHAQVQASIAAGAKCVLGGEVPEGAGAFYPVTLLTDVREGMPAYDEELFGSVAAVIKARDEADALRIANASRFGLGGGIFTQDSARAEALARKMECGAVAINGYVKSDPRLPFGGVKESGYGRELSHFGIREFVNIKSVVIT